VRGRGAVHQVDVLGQLAWIPAFTFPIRLFVEAMWHRRSRTGLADVRNAVGVLQDVNENYTTQNGPDRSRLIRRFNYCYSLFSTTGFTAPAQEMALAHQISLIDLSGPGFDDLREIVDELGDLLYALYQEEDESGAAIRSRKLRPSLSSFQTVRLSPRSSFLRQRRRPGRLVVAPDKPSSLKTLLHPARFNAFSRRSAFWSSVDTRA
jgi:hypothetical protein